MTPERWQQVERLYNAALEREASQRAAFLTQACRGDDELRHEVESLLAQDDGASLLEKPALDVAAKALGGDGGPSLLGRQIGGYQVISLLGAGGMGEVYEARDSKLGRKVAIKILPATFANDAERLARFQREARMLAALNHPNIATIHGLEQSGGVHYLVMELVPGQTLAERIGKGASPTEETLKVAGQIAAALEAAHEKGMIHRDLKPANIKVTPEGQVKVLDFGLAKAFAGDGAQDFSQSPTLSQEGRILGTPSYMSPEQARGLPVDKRTDIWAFGCVLYEMLTGRTPFAGQTLSDILAAILKHEPDWGALPERTPPKIRDLLRRCLQKDSQRRLRDIGDARLEIEELSAAPANATPAQTAATPAREPWRHAPFWLATCVVLAAFTGIAVWKLKPSPPSAPRPAGHFLLPMPPDVRLVPNFSDLSIVLSPDGTHLAFVGHRGANSQLYLRAIEGAETMALQGTDGATNPFFSPDGQWLAFFAQGKLKKVPTSGGDADVKGKRVLVRVDLNVPMQDGKVADVSRIERNSPTILEIADRGGKVVLLSHFGRPKGRDAKDSLRPVAAAVAAHLGRKVAFADDCIGEAAEQRCRRAEARRHSAASKTPVSITARKRTTPPSSRELAELGDLYVNDAFSAAHRAHASTEGLARIAAGLCRPRHAGGTEGAGQGAAHPGAPGAAIVGGAKISTKLDLLGNLVGQVDLLVIGGGMANTFLAAARQEGRQIPVRG